jgi:hypothetical protein
VLNADWRPAGQLGHALFGFVFVVEGFLAEPLLYSQASFSDYLLEQAFPYVSSVRVRDLDHAFLTLHELRVVADPCVRTGEAQFLKPLDQIVALRLLGELAHGLCGSSGSRRTIQVQAVDHRDLQAEPTLYRNPFHYRVAQVAARFQRRAALPPGPLKALN